MFVSGKDTFRSAAPQGAILNQLHGCERLLEKASFAEEIVMANMFDRILSFFVHAFLSFLDQFFEF